MRWTTQGVRITPSQPLASNANCMILNWYSSNPVPCPNLQPQLRDESDQMRAEFRKVKESVMAGDQIIQNIYHVFCSSSRDSDRSNRSTSSRSGRVGSRPQMVAQWARLELVVFFLFLWRFRQLEMAISARATGGVNSTRSARHTLAQGPRKETRRTLRVNLFARQQNSLSIRALLAVILDTNTSTI